MPWYEQLNKSSLTPPSYVFGIVWPVLYTLMGVSAYLVLTNKKCMPYCNGIILFGVQLVFNLIWTTLFFRLKMPLLALIDLIITFGLMVFTLFEFYRIDHVVFWMNVPYTLWLMFAGYLNAYIWWNN